MDVFVDGGQQDVALEVDEALLVLGPYDGHVVQVA